MLTYGVIVKDEQEYLEQLIPHLLQHKHPTHTVRVLVDVEQTPKGIIDRHATFDEYMTDTKIRELREKMLG